MAKVEVLETPRLVAQQDVAGLLRCWLVAAEEGKLTAIGLCAVNFDGSTATAYEPGFDKTSLLAAVTRLQHRMLTDSNSVPGFPEPAGA